MEQYMLEPVPTTRSRDLRIKFSEILQAAIK